MIDTTVEMFNKKNFRNQQNHIHEMEDNMNHLIPATPSKKIRKKLDSYEASGSPSNINKQKQRSLTFDDDDYLLDNKKNDNGDFLNDNELNYLQNLKDNEALLEYFTTIKEGLNSLFI